MYEVVQRFKVHTVRRRHVAISLLLGESCGDYFYILSEDEDVKEGWVQVGEINITQTKHNLRPNHTHSCLIKQTGSGWECEQVMAVDCAMLCCLLLLSTKVPARLFRPQQSRSVGCVLRPGGASAMQLVLKLQLCSNLIMRESTVLLLFKKCSLTEATLPCGCCMWTYTHRKMQYTGKCVLPPCAVIIGG